MLTYLGGSKNSNIAKSYVNFIQASAKEEDFNILNDIYKKSNNIKEPIEPEDITFIETLKDLTTMGVNIAPTQYLEYLDTTTISLSDINQLVAQIATYVETSTSSSTTQNARDLCTDLLRIMIGAEKYYLATEYAGIDAKIISKDILGIQLKELEKLDGNDSDIVAAINYANKRLASINADLNPGTTTLTAEEEMSYKAFVAGFPVGQTPTAAQSAAATALITTGGNFGNNLAFLTNYGKFVSSGDTTSADNLVEIANYFGSKPEYASIINSFRNAYLDAESISTAKEIIDFTKILDAQNSPDLTSLISNINNDFVINTVLRGVGNIFNSATESDLTKDFFQSLKDTFNNKPASIDNKTYSTFANNSIYYFSNDHLRLDGVVYSNSLTAAFVKEINEGYPMGIYANDGVAQMQIDVFEGMLSFYQSQIQQENAKPEPNTSKIGQWQNQINSHQTAINSLRSTL